MISFVVPAHNEERLLGRTLLAIHTAAGAVGGPFEIVVVDDASTDRTAAIAADHGAIVERVELRQISAVRNAGARRAKGDILIFVDADTVVPPATLAAALRALGRGSVGGGGTVAFDELGASWAGLIVKLWTCISRLGRLAAGCFIFVRRSAFEAVGGFNESYFAGEELFLSLALQTQGRFVILGERVLTSARKAHTHSLFEISGVFLRLLLRGPKGCQSRDGLDLWYKRREPPAST